MENEEVWLPVLEFEGLYEVSNFGRVRRFSGQSVNNVVLKPSNKNGYLKVGLYKNGVQTTFTVHQLVAKAFLGLPVGEIGRNKGQYGVNHINAIKTDNRPKNLQWTTTEENLDHANRMGLMPKGEKTGHAKLSSKDVEEIRLRLQNSERNADLAREFDVNPGTISAIRSGKNWKMIEEITYPKLTTHN